MVRHRWVLLAALSVVAGGAGAAFAAGVGRDHPAPRGPVIATVDGAAIHAPEASARMASLASVHGGQAPADTPAWRQKVLQSLVDDVLVREEAARRGVRITAADIDQGVARVRRMLPSEAEFATWLSKQGMDRRELERRVQLQLLWARVRERVIAGVTVADAEIESYYREHAADFTSDGRLKPLFEVKSSIADTLRTDKQDRAFGDWLAARRKAATVVVVAKEWGGTR